MKTLNTINELIEKAESENERRILDTVKNTLIGEVKEASKKALLCSWWTEGTVHMMMTDTRMMMKKKLYMQTGLLILLRVLYMTMMKNN